MDADPALLAAPFRDPRYASRRLEIEQRDGGEMVLTNPAPYATKFQTMTAALAHRGPDGQGTLVKQSANAQVGLGHRRLSIIDLSAFAGQPMSFDQLHITFNGEIYNYRELTAELQQHHVGAEVVERRIEHAAHDHRAQRRQDQPEPGLRWGEQGQVARLSRTTRPHPRVRSGLRLGQFPNPRL